MCMPIHASVGMTRDVGPMCLSMYAFVGMTRDVGPMCPSIHAPCPSMLSCMWE